MPSGTGPISLEPDEGQALEAPVGPELHLVEHDRHGAGDSLQKLGAVRVERLIERLSCHQSLYRQDATTTKAPAAR
jgi:hypothetical protein